MPTDILLPSHGISALLLANNDGSSTFDLPSPRPHRHDDIAARLLQPAATAPSTNAAGCGAASEDWPWPLCPSRGHQQYRSPRTGRYQPKMCGAIRCWVCVVPVALSYARAIALAEPDQLVRLSLVGDDWTTIRGRVNRYRQHLRAQGLAVQDTYHVEANPRGTGNHLHMWIWGDLLLEPTVRNAALSAGMGREVDVRAAYLPEQGVPALTYGMKAVLDRPRHTSSMPVQAEHYLELNGQRLLHSTRSFWRDAATGETLAGVRAAAVAARKRNPRALQQVAA